LVVRQHGARLIVGKRGVDIVDTAIN